MCGFRSRSQFLIEKLQSFGELHTLKSNLLAAACSLRLGTNWGTPAHLLVRSLGGKPSPPVSELFNLLVLSGSIRISPTKSYSL